MTKETEFVRIKRAVEAEKTKKVQGEAKLESLKQEEERILAEVKELTGEDLTTPEEVGTYSERLKSTIEEKILKMKEILDSEGVAY